MSSSLSKKEIRQLLKTAKECIDNKEYENTMAHCRRIVKADPQNFHAHLLAGFACRHLSQWEQAEKLYRRAITLQEDNVQGWLGLCELLEAQHSEADRSTSPPQQQQKTDLQPVYRRLLQFFEESNDEKKWCECAEKLAGMLEQGPERLDLLKKLERKTDDPHAKVDLMAQIADFVYDEELGEIEAMIDERERQHIAELRRREEQKLTRRRRLSAKELQSMIPSDEELLPAEQRKELREQTWEAECTNTYLLQNEQSKFDHYVEQMMLISRSRTPMHIERMLIERNFRRLALSGEQKYQKLVIEQCKRLLDFHKSAYYPMELLLLLAEEDGVKLESQFLRTLENRMMHAHPFEGMSMTIIAMRLLDKVDEHTVQSSAGATREHNVLDDIELLLTKGLELSPSYITAWLELGRVNLMRAKYLKALDCVKHAQANLSRREEQFQSQLGKLKTEAKLLHADTYRKMPRQQRRAELLYKEVVEDEPANTRALKGLAHIATQNDNFEFAIQTWERVLELDPNDHEACSELSWIHHRCGNLEAALELALRANDAVPHFLYRHRLARVYWDMGDTFRKDKQYCHSLLLQSAKLNPEYAPNFTYLGHYYATVEHSQDRCIKCYRKAIALDPMEEEAGNALGDLYERNKLYTLAITLYRDACSRSTRAKWAWKRMGFYEQSQGRLDEALIAFQHALRFDQSDAMCWLGYAETMSRQGKFLASVKAYTRAYELDSSLTYAVCQMAYIKSLLGDFAGALDLFKQAIMADPSMLTAYTGLADVHRSVAKLDFEDGLFVDSALNLMKAQLLLWSKESEFEAFRAPWKQLGDIQSLFYLLPESAVHDAFAKIQGGDLDSIYSTANSDGKGISRLRSEKLYYVQLARNSYQRALDRIPADKGDLKAAAYFDLGIANYYCKELLMGGGDGGESAHAAMEQDALAALREAISIEPQNSTFWNAMGCAYSDPLRKQHCFIKALQYNGKFHVAWNNLGVLYLQQGAFNLAQQAFIKAQDMMPSDCVPFIGLAMLNEKIGTQRALDKAREGFAHSVSLENTALAYIGLGYTAFQKREFQTSSTAMLKYLQFYDSDPDAYNVLALALEAQGRYEEAENALRSCCTILEKRVKERPEIPISNRERGLVERESGIVFRGEESIAAEEKLTLAKMNLGRVLMALGKYDEAYDALSSHVLPRVPLVSESAVKMDLSLCCFHMQKLDDSFRLIAESIQISSQETDDSHDSYSIREQAMLLRAKLYYHSGDYANASRHFIECMKQFPRSLKPHLAYAAFSALTSSDPEVALKIMKRINDKITFGTNREALLLQSNIYLLHGDVTRARNTISKLVHLFPQRHDMWDQLAALTATASQVTSTSGSVSNTGQGSSVTPEAISQLCAQLLGPSLSHFARVQFENDPNRLTDRLYIVACLYYAMGVAPRYHGAETALRHAMSMAQKALRIDPTHQGARRLTASCMHSIAALKGQQHLFHASAELLQKYITPTVSTGGAEKDLSLMIALAEDRANSGQVDEAIRIIRDAIRSVAGKDAELESTLLATLGRCVRVRGQPDSRDKALQCFENAIKKQPSNMFAWFSLADMLIAEEQFRAAESVLLTCKRIVLGDGGDSDEVAHVPDNAQFALHVLLAFVCYRLGYAKQGVKHARAAVKKYSSSPVAVLLLGQLLQMRGDVVKAEPHLRDALHLGPDMPLTNMALYKIHYAREEWAEAEQCLWRERDMQPQSGFVLYSLAVFAYESGAPESALPLIQKAIRLEPANEHYWHVMHEIYQMIAPPPAASSDDKRKKKKK